MSLTLSRCEIQEKIEYLKKNIENQTLGSFKQAGIRELKRLKEQLDKLSAHEQDLKEFVERCSNSEVIHKQILDLEEEQKQKAKTQQKLYSQTIKGRESMMRGWQRRKGRKTNAKVELEEKEYNEIKEFYVNTPQGHEVDHIIPLCKGGKHCLENLQYLPMNEHRKKFVRIRKEDLVRVANDQYISTGVLMRRFKLNWKDAVNLIEECQKIIDEHPELAIEVIR